MERTASWDWVALYERAGDFIIFAMFMLLVLLVGTYTNENLKGKGDDR